jgi:hypothetical protein
MDIFITNSGEWGYAEELLFVRADDWNDEDHAVFAALTRDEKRAYADGAGAGADDEGMTPTQWKKVTQ